MLQKNLTIKNVFTQTGEAADGVSKEETEDEEGSVEKSAEAAADESKEGTEEQADASEEKAEEISEKEEQSEETVTEESAEVSTFQEGKINNYSCFKIK